MTTQEFENEFKDSIEELLECSSMAGFEPEYTVDLLDNPNVTLFHVIQGQFRVNASGSVAVDSYLVFTPQMLNDMQRCMGRIEKAWNAYVG